MGVLMYQVNVTRKQTDIEQSMKREVDVMTALMLYNVDNSNNHDHNQSECQYLWKAKTADGWFEQNFKSSLKPTWTATHANISMDAFQWWMSLSSSNETYDAVLHLAKELVDADRDGFLNRSTSTSCIRCAVVGNSQNLKRSGYGQLINKHNMIIRMNQCPTKGYEKDVGSRTTHYIAYPSSFNDDYLTADASLVFAAFNLEDMKWLKSKLIDSSNITKSDDANLIDKNKVFLFNPELMWHIKHQWGLGKGKWASTGLLSVFFALQQCDEVNIFGFGANHKGNWDHYFEDNNGETNSQFRETLVHDSEAETGLLNKLVKAKKIRMFKGFR